MKKLALLVVGAALTGFLLGSVAQRSGDSGDKCRELEEKLVGEHRFNGSLSCYTPGKVNLSENVERESELQCVCVNVFNGRKSVFTVSRSQ